MKWVKDLTGRFPQRPYYLPDELDQESEAIISDFLRKRHGRVALPVATDDLYVLLEQETDDLDAYADLASEGCDVEGVTDFLPGQKPRVRIARELSADPRRENRLRTTLTHELGHVKFHNFLWAFGQRSLDAALARRASPRCKRELILMAGPTDWMEWQAGYASGAILMPISALRKVVVDLRDELNRLGDLELGDPASDELIQRVRNTFRVSEDAARVRLLKRNYIVEKSGNRSLFDSPVTG